MREIVLGSSSQYGFAVNGSGIVLNSRRYQGTNSDYMVSARIANNISINLTPFRTLRITYVCNYAYETKNDGDYKYNSADVEVHKADKNKTFIKQFGKDYHMSTEEVVVSSFDITSINEQAFIYIRFQSLDRANVGAARIIRIEFLN